MGTALSALQNATATFTVAGTGVTTDANTGNVNPVSATVSASMYLKAETVETQEYPGVNVVETVYTGYVTGGALDSRVVVGTEGTLTFAGASAVDCEVTALRLPYGKTGLLGTALGTALGEAITLVSKAQS